MLDLRVPAGYFFVLLGTILVLVGLFVTVTPAPLSAEWNVNLYTGIALLLFGGALLWMSRLGKKS
jgi:uncharacterized membrane protein HdeD (DUF308 family)